MLSKITIATVVAAAGIIAATLPLSAASLPSSSALKATAAASSQIEKTHGWHRTCRRTVSINSSHKHVRGVGRIQCTSARCTTNFWGYKTCKYR